MSYLFDTEERQETKSTAAGALGRAVGADNEIALGTRSLLGIFFGLVLICAIFFGLGYSVGRGSGSRAAVQAPETTLATDSHPNKPAAEQSLTPVSQESAEQDTAATTPESGPAPPADAEDEPPTQAPPASSVPRASVTPPAPKPSAAAPATPVPTTPAPTATTTPAMSTVPATAATSFMVQVAAVRIAQDAQILVDALKKHGYTAVIRHEAQDQLLHIQLGPFTSRADAYAMRSKLLADGYNAVVK